METAELTTLMDAIASIQVDLKDVKDQNAALLEQNRELRMLLNGVMNTIPTIIRNQLEDFLEQFAQALENRKPSQTAEAIRELAGVMKDLKQRIVDSEMIHADMIAQVSYARQEIQTFATQLFESLPKTQPPALEPTEQPSAAKTKPKTQK